MTGSSRSYLRSILTDSRAYKFSVEVETDPSGKMRVICGSSGMVVGVQPTAELSMFLPEGDSKRINNSDKFAAAILSAGLRQRVMAWLQEQAAARLGKGGKP